MLRVLRRHVGSTATSPAALLRLCRGASGCDAHDVFRGVQEHLAPSGKVNSSFVNSCFRATDTSISSFEHRQYSTSANKTAASETSSETNTASSSGKTLADFQHEEIVGPTVERDMSPVADELRKAHLEMTEAIRKFTKALLAVGTVHLVWGGMMFRAMESPFSHGLMTQVGVSALVLYGLAYYSRQTLKPIEFFMRVEERSRIQILTLSLQVTKTLSSFFQRSYGVGLVLFVALLANLVGCLKFLF
ncbi:hypothetical protein KP509_25G035400 [Ceratopteris richardii]|uniref:Uncharacterized protein n=1 Tax=Ceratopteris richardii TaxID=49495 RepID=A0A8T2RS71_CERRI|nr:hypothetical protein KP509_25G035400 [Ceratopteris richardii]